MHTAASVVRGLPVDIPGAVAQLLFFAVVLLTAHRHESDNVVLVQFRKVTHVNVTVSLVVDVAVIVATVKPPLVDVDEVTPAEKVAV
jgi:hypothetical protein